MFDHLVAECDVFGCCIFLQDHILIPILSEDPSDDAKDDPVLVVHPNYVTE